MRKLFIIIVTFCLFLSVVSAEEQNNVLAYSAMKTQYISTDINIVLPIYFSNYTSSDEFTYKTAIFLDQENQDADVTGYYYDNDGSKIFGDIISENGNDYVLFKVRPIRRSEYVFYISGKIISENKFVLPNQTVSLENIPEDIKEFIKATKFIQSDSSEIRTVANFLKKDDDPIENLVNITNWVHSYVTYDLDYVSMINDSIAVLSDRKGVCDEFAILEAAILRAQGYPVRYVVGYANTSQEWGAHAWLEVYMSGIGWISVDPTYNEVGIVDATHIVLEKLKDPRESKDSVTSTNEVDVRFGEKKQYFTHQEVKTYEQAGLGDNVDFTIVTSGQAQQGSPHIAKLRLKNKTDNPIIILVASQLANDFIQIYPKERKTIYYLKPLETKTTDYFFKLPNLESSYIYIFGFISQYKDKTTDLNIYSNKGEYQELFFYYDPIIYYKNGMLVFENKIFNYTKKDKQLSYVFDYFGTSYSETKTIEKYTESTYTRNFPKTENVNFSYSILGDYNSSSVIPILPAIEIPYVSDINLEDHNQLHTEEDKNKAELFSKYSENKIQEKPKSNYVMIGFVVAFILFIIIMFFSKMIKKENNQ